MISPSWLSLLFNRFTGMALAIALAAGTYWVHRGNLIGEGYDSAMAEVELSQADLARELMRDRSRLITTIEGLHRDQHAQRLALKNFRAGQRDADQRLRDAQGDFDRRLAAASAEALRGYAAAVDGDLGRCEQHVERFADEAAQCASAAHTLKGYVDALP